MGTGASTIQTERPSTRYKDIKAPSYVDPDAVCSDQKSRGLEQALKIILHTDASKLAFIKYLEKCGLSIYLDFYFDLVSITDQNDSQTLDIKFIESVRKFYNPSTLITRGNGEIPPSPVVQQWVWKHADTLCDTFTQTRSPIIFEVALETISRDASFISTPPPMIFEDMLQETLQSTVNVLCSHIADFMNSSEYKMWQDSLLVPSSGSNSHLKDNVSNYSDDDISSSSYMGVHVVRSLADRYKNVLLVDDSQVVAKLARSMLEANGHNVKVATSGREALESCIETVFDLIIIDLYMPIMDGFEAVRQFRTFEKESSAYVITSKTVIVAMSSDCGTEVVSKAIAAGVDFFLDKPFTLKKLTKGLEEVEFQAKR